MYYIKAVDKGKVGYWYGVDNVVTNVNYGLFLFLVYTQVVLVFSVQLIVGRELFLI